jgi:hypothetical protein
MGTFGKALLSFMLLLALPVAALGQAGYIGLYADPAATECAISDRGGSEVKVYVVHQATSGAASSEWRIAAAGGFGMTYVGETWSTAVIGDTQSGVSASYGACLAAPILLCTVTYVSHGTSPACAYLEVVADPGSVNGTIDVVDCSSRVVPASGGKLFVNADDSCPCGQTSGVYTTDWGRIKALFSD